MSYPLLRSSRRRRLAIVGAVALGALTVAGFAYSTGGPNAKLVNEDRLYGGGGTDPGCFVPDINLCRAGSTNLALDAHATGTGESAYGDSIHRAGLHVQVTCLAVDGSNAAVGGVVVASPDPTQVGRWSLVWYVDSGPGQLDLVSPSHFVTPADLSASGVPPRFPYDCPSPNTGAPDFGLFRSFLPLARGNIVVHDG